jgi:GNAT superfamily N-acetyltransferase
MAVFHVDPEFPMTGTVVHATPEQMENHVEALAELLIDCVEGGASVSFMLPLPKETALGYWRDILESVRAGDTVPFLAFADSELTGVVLLRLSKLPNQPHVAEISKLLVPRKLRRQGIARRLMQALEDEACKQNRNLLVLDTIKYGIAETLYFQIGYKLAGTIPGYALTPDGKKGESVILYKQL